MSKLQNILIYHPAAIGDSVLATPVSALLKQHFPDSIISYLTHSNLVPLLSLCKAIDTFIPYNKEQSGRQRRKLIAEAKPDIIVDLSGSTKSFLETTALAPKIFRYKKQPSNKRPIQHAANNFLASIAGLNLQAPQALFPTLRPQMPDCVKIRKMLPTIEKKLVAAVPGVGTARPHRAWSENNWLSLAKQISQNYTLLLIGGSEEKELCRRLKEEAGPACIDLSGQLSLAETAAALSLCSSTISGDTGPAHISVAVGVPVIGIYGATYPERSGPYAMESHLLSAANSCSCHSLKYCRFSSGSGACMEKITVAEVYAKLANLYI